MSLNGTETNPIWIVTPSDRRRRDEEIPEKQLGKVISAVEAMNNRGPKLGTKDDEKEAGLSRQVTPITSSSNSSNDGSGEEEPSTSANIKKRISGRLTPNSDDSKEIHKAASTRKRGSTSDDSSNISGSDGAASQKRVKFSQESNDGSTDKKQNVAKAKTVVRVGTRATRGSACEALAGLLPDVMPRKKGVPKKNVKKNENVVVVKMLTGTLYLHRGDRRRAEFVRHK
jgi:hypothetical protein